MQLVHSEFNQAPQAYDYEKITVDATAGGVGLTAAKIQPTGEQAVRRVEVFVETQPIRYLFNPTATKAVDATDGIPVAAGSSFFVDGLENIKNLRMIRSTGSSATAHVIYER